jgi:hypothetical protein
MKNMKKIGFGFIILFALIGATTIASNILFDDISHLERQLVEIEKDRSFFKEQKELFAKKEQEKIDYFNATRCVLANLKREKGIEVNEETRSLCFRTE